jgi:hypothetical protein
MPTRKPRKRDWRVSHVPDLYFLHIPKAAGTSFRLWLHRLFAVDDILPVDHLNQLESLDTRHLKRNHFASGHFGWRLMELSKAAGTAFDPVTILREPVDHVLSGFRYTTDLTEDDLARLGEGADRHREMGELILASFHDASLSPEEATAKLRSEAADLQRQFNNTTLRFIALWGTEDTSAPPTGELELGLARARLEEMRFFGLVEDWEGTAILFADTYGLPLRAMDYRHNSTAGEVPSVPQTFIEGVRRTHGLDLSLYAYARFVFRERLEAVRRKFDLALDASFDDFREPLLQQFLHTDSGVPRLSDAMVPLSAGIIQDGFERRYPDERGRWRLWSGPTVESTLYLPLDRSQALTLRFQGDIFLSDPIRNELRVQVDGVEVSVERSYVKARNNYRMQMELLVPPDSKAGQYSAITFIVPEVIAQDDEALAPATAFALGGFIEVEPTPEKSHLLSEATIPLSGSILQDGFERRYPDGGGGWHLWSGVTSESSLYLPLDRNQTLTLRFQGDVFLSDTIRDELRIQVDGTDLAIRRQFVKVGERYCVQMEMLVPADADAALLSTVTFIVPELVTQFDDALAPATAFALGGCIEISIAPPVEATLEADESSDDVLAHGAGEQGQDPLSELRREDNEQKQESEACVSNS